MPRTIPKQTSRPTRPTRTPPKEPVTSFAPLLAVVALVVACAFVATAFWMKYEEWQEARLLSARRAAEVQDLSPEEVTQRVARHILVDAQSNPAIATVQNPDLLKSQNPIFYRNASVGDRLLVWPDKAILYSVAQDRLLAVLPGPGTNQTSSSSIDTAPQGETEPATTSTFGFNENAKIEIRNGTRTAGLARQLSMTLMSMSRFPFHVVKTSDAVRKNYAKTLIVSRYPQSYPQTITTLQEILGASVTSTTGVETDIQGDIVIIIGSDYQK